MLPSISQHAKKHGIEPLKRLGQNFIFDLSLCEKIVTTTQSLVGKTILEIGPGTAGLTRAILKSNPKRLIAIEKDIRCILLLNEIKEIYPQLEIINGDALNIKLDSLIGNEKITIIANLPYNIGTELIFRWLDQINYIEEITVMLQKEVVDRICAIPGSKIYGRLSVMCQLFANVEKRFDVAPSAFYPRPKVISSILNMKPKSNIPEPKIINIIGKITKAAFGARRKMIKASLKKILPNIEVILQKAKIENSLRAENLSLNDYIKIALIIDADNEIS